MSNGIGEVQYPSQTLAYGSGSVLDAGLLYAACLQATGTSAALVLFPDGEVVAAVGLGIEPSGASMTALFNGTDKILIAGDDVWIPAAMSRLGDGFSVAWQEGINRINNMLNNNESAEMIIIDEAWITYPPASFPSSGIRLVMPDSNTINTAGNAVVQNYIRSEFGPKISAVQDQIRRSPNATLYNQLGNLLLRSQQTAQAKTAYETAAGMGLTGAMVNRGNIALNENDIAGAERWFKQALAREPQNKSALKGMEFVEARK
jgi:tetratricopeptide (TPR) repeat protein